MPKDSSRTLSKLLAAAQTVVQRDGAHALTLDAVAKEAGLSKGGLLYHFPSKDALIQGLIAATLASFEERVAALMTADEEPIGRWTRAYWRATLEDGQAEALASMFASAMLDPAQLPAMLAQHDAWQSRSAADGLDPAMAALVRLAADGYWFSQIHGIAPADGPTTAQLQALIMALTQGR